MKHRENTSLMLKCMASATAKYVMCIERNSDFEMLRRNHEPRHKRYIDFYDQGNRFGTAALNHIATVEEKLRIITEMIRGG